MVNEIFLNILPIYAPLLTNNNYLTKQTLIKVSILIIIIIIIYIGYLKYILYVIYHLIKV